MGEKYLKDLQKRRSYLNKINIDEISESGVGYRAGKKEIANFFTN